MNKVVARYVDGRLLKGFTRDFNPLKEQFRVTLEGAATGDPPVTVNRDDLKALFFVKDFGGNPDHDEKKVFDAELSRPGRRIRVVFKDGEILLGTTLGYGQDRPGFFMESVDEDSNIERCYVVSGSTQEITLE